jgi:hypothetical protein
MFEKEIPFRAVCDLVFKQDLLPAVYRWISGLPPETLLRFRSVFSRIANDIGKGESADVPASPSEGSSFASEMPIFSPLPSRDLSPDHLLSRPTSSHLTYGAFDGEQMRACRAVPTRTREDERSQILTAERSGANMDFWTERAMNTTYCHDVCRTPTERTVRDETPDQMVIVCSKGTLNDEAAERAKHFIGRDAVWTREFRDLCRALSTAIDATTYRAGFTAAKAVHTPHHPRPKWTDPVPVSQGLARPAETFWQTSNRAEFVPITRSEEEYRPPDTRKASFAKPFDVHPSADRKMTTATRENFPDHFASRNERPEYFADTRVCFSPASAVAGQIVGRRM